MLKINNNEYELRFSLNDRVNLSNLIFLHEGLGSNKSWFQLPKNIEKQIPINTLLYNRVPHGKNEFDLPEKFDYFDYQVEELRNIIRALNLHKPILLGHSDGATIALLYAAKYPDDVKSVICMAAHIYSEEITDKGVKDTLDSYLNGNLKERLQKQHGKNTDSVFYKWYNFWSTAKDKNLDLTEHLKKVNAPVLALQGDKDQYATDQHLWDIQKAITNCKAYIIPNCGHFPHVSQPKQVLEKILNFIKQ